MKNEEQLSIQLQAMRDQFSLRKTNLQDQVGHLELMREEVSEQKMFLKWWMAFLFQLPVNITL